MSRFQQHQQYFHLLRHQMKRNFRRPLIVAGPKSVIRIQAVRFLACLLYPIAPSRIHSRQAAASSLDLKSSPREASSTPSSTTPRPPPPLDCLARGPDLRKPLLRPRQRARRAGSRRPRRAPYTSRSALRSLVRCDAAGEVLWVGCGGAQLVLIVLVILDLVVPENMHTTKLYLNASFH